LLASSRTLGVFALRGLTGAGDTVVYVALGLPKMIIVDLIERQEAPDMAS
jgi:hypothetical protein